MRPPGLYRLSVQALLGANAIEWADESGKMNAKAPSDPPPGSDEALAADLVLGVLSDSERDCAERKAAAEPDFAQLVAEWRRRLAPLPEPVQLVEPPRRLWDRIVAEISRKR